MPSLALWIFWDRLKWFLRTNSVQPYCNSTGYSTGPPGRTCVQIPCQQDTPAFPVCWTKVESRSAGKTDETFLRFAVEEFQTGLHGHWLLGNSLLADHWSRQLPFGAKCLKADERRNRACNNNVLYLAWLSRGQWMDAHKQCEDHWETQAQVIWTESLLKILLLICNHVACYN